MTIDPEKAPVTPRVISPETGDELPVDESFPNVAGTSRHPIEILGGPGSGKTTTLRHLAAVLPEGVLVDPA